MSDLDFIDVQHSGSVLVMDLQVSGCVSMAVSEPVLGSHSDVFMSADQARAIAAALIAAADAIQDG